MSEKRFQVYKLPGGFDRRIFLKEKDCSLSEPHVVIREVNGTDPLDAASTYLKVYGNGVRGRLFEHEDGKMEIIY